MRALNTRMRSDLSRLPDGTHHVQLPDGRCAFTKIRSRAPEGFFVAEARGLAALRSASALRVPISMLWERSTTSATLRPPSL